MESRHFLRIAQSYSPKNKLAAEIQSAIEPLDRTLFPNEASIKRLISLRFLNACQEYLEGGGKARLPDYKEYETSNGFGIHISDCMIFHADAVADELP